MIAAPIMAAVAGMVLVRLGWSAGRAIAVLGWALAAAALFLLARAAGAWGVSVGAAAAMAAALALLPWPGWSAPARTRPAYRDRVARMGTAGSIGLARRLAVFLLVVPIGGVATLWLAFAAQAAARHAGMTSADAAVCLLFLAPILWCGLMTWQMTRDGPRRMAVPPVIVAALGAILWTAR